MLKLVAGDVNRAEDDRRRGRLMDLAAKATSAAEARREFVAEEFFEYHLHTLDGRTTIKESQTKQLALLSAAGVAVEKRLAYLGAQDELVKIKLGNAFDVVGERTQKDWRKIADGLYEVEWEIVLRNHKKVDQAVTVIEPVPGDWQVLSSTHRWGKVASHTLRYEMAVPKEGSAKLVYRVRLRF